RGWNVLFGTGKLNEDSDYTGASSTLSRGFYNIVDKAATSAPAELLVSGSDVVAITTTDSNLATDLVGRSWTKPNLTGKKGWRMSFSGGERVLTNSTVPPDTGAVLFATTQPTGNVCQAGNSGFLMAVNICSGSTGDLVVFG